MSEKFKAIVLNQSGEKFSREIKTLDKSFFKGGDVLVKVNYSEQLGNETYFYCSTDTMKQLIVHQAGQYKVSKGENIYLRFDRENIHLFGADGKVILNKIIK